MTLIECKACGKKISTNAKECPHCSELTVREVKKQIWVWFFMVMFALGFLGLILGLQLNETEQASVDTTSVNIRPYKILQDKRTKDIKRVVKVMLKERVSNKTLKGIGQKIKQEDTRSYKRTFIGYFLPETNQDFGYWATTDFNPYLKVKIYGTTLKGEKLLTKKLEVNPDRKIIGTWLLEGALGLTRMTFFTDKDDKLFLEQTFDDEGKLISSISEINNSNLSRKLIDEDKYKNYGEYYLLTPSGKLEYWDKEGLLGSANK